MHVYRIVCMYVCAPAASCPWNRCSCFLPVLLSTSHTHLLCISNLHGLLNLLVAPCRNASDVLVPQVSYFSTKRFCYLDLLVPVFKSPSCLGLFSPFATPSPPSLPPPPERDPPPLDRDTPVPSHTPDASHRAPRVEFSEGSGGCLSSLGGERGRLLPGGERIASLHLVLSQSMRRTLPDCLSTTRMPCLLLRGGTSNEGRGTVAFSTPSTPTPSLPLAMALPAPSSTASAQLLRCQYLYVCTSKASKVSEYLRAIPLLCPSSAGAEDARHLSRCQYLHFCSGKASKVSKVSI
jgi:hypothetical protein